jgi:hypothetical protein
MACPEKQPGKFCMLETGNFYADNVVDKLKTVLERKGLIIDRKNKIVGTQEQIEEYNLSKEVSEISLEEQQLLDELEQPKVVKPKTVKPKVAAVAKSIPKSCEAKCGENFCNVTTGRCIEKTSRGNPRSEAVVKKRYGADYKINKEFGVLGRAQDVDEEVQKLVDQGISPKEIVVKEKVKPTILEIIDCRQDTKLCTDDNKYCNVTSGKCAKKSSKGTPFGVGALKKAYKGDLDIDTSKFLLGKQADMAKYRVQKPVVPPKPSIQKPILPPKPIKLVFQQSVPKSVVIEAGPSEPESVKIVEYEKEKSKKKTPKTKQQRLAKIESPKCLDPEGNIVCDDNEFCDINSGECIDKGKKYVLDIDDKYITANDKRELLALQEILGGKIYPRKEIIRKSPPREEVLVEEEAEILPVVEEEPVVQKDILYEESQIEDETIDDVSREEIKERLRKCLQEL